jgi:hypothetical protein
VQHMRELLVASGIYSILVGLIALSSRVVAVVFAYQVKDVGVLRVFAATSLALGLVLFGLSTLVAQEQALTGSSRLEKYRGIAPYLAVAFAVAVVLLAWGWASGHYTTRNVLVPLIIEIIFTVWAWQNRPSRFAQTPR